MKCITNENLIPLIIDIMKDMKADNIAILPRGVILGSDNDYTILKQTVNNTLCDMPCAFSSSDLKTFIEKYEEDDSKEIYYDDSLMGFKLETSKTTGLIKNINEVSLIFNPIIYENLLAMYNNNWAITNRASPSISNVLISSKDDNYNFLYTMSAGDGAMSLRIDKYIMMIFKSLLPLNKSDMCELRIYDIDQFSFLSVFNIMKKKRCISVSIKYLRI